MRLSLFRRITKILKAYSLKEARCSVFFLLLVSCVESANMDLWEKIGFPLDEPGISTLWGQLNQRSQQANTSGKNLFGDQDQAVPQTLFGRLNIWMNQLAFWESQQPEEKQRVPSAATLLQEIEDLMQHLRQDTFPLGNWFDDASRETIFGGVATLTQALFKDAPLFSSLPTLPNDKAGLQEICQVFETFFRKILPFLDRLRLEKAWGLIESLHSQSADLNPQSATWLDFLNEFADEYGRVFVGSLEDPASTAAEAPLLSRIAALKNELLPEIYQAAVQDLGQLYDISHGLQHHPPTLEAWCELFCLTGAVESTNSLNAHLESAASVGTPFNLGEDFDAEKEDQETPTKSTFFTTFQHLVERTFSRQDKEKRLQTILGERDDLPEKPTVFGFCARINETWNDSPESTFQHLLFGRREEETEKRLPSFTTELCGFKALFEQEKSKILDENLQKILRQIGRLGDTEPVSLMGALHQVMVTQNQSQDGKEFLEHLGYMTSEDVLPTSCLGRVRQWTEFSLSPRLFEATPECIRPYLSQLPRQTLLALQEKSSNGSLQEADLRAALAEDLAQRVGGPSASSLLTQTANLKQWLQNDSFFDEVIFRLGEVADLAFLSEEEMSEALSDITLFARLQRLAQLLPLFAQIIPLEGFAMLDTLLFSGLNSVQSCLYEIQAQVYNHLENLPYIIGSITSRDASLFGLMNQALYLLEGEPFMNALQGLGEMRKFLDDNPLNLSLSELDQVNSYVGIEEKESDFYLKTLVDMFPYLEKVHKTAFFLTPYSDILKFRKKFFAVAAEADEVCLQSLFQKFLSSKTSYAMATVCGSSLDSEMESIWGITKNLMLSIYSGIMKVFERERTWTHLSVASDVQKVERLRREVLQQAFSYGQKNRVRLDVQYFIDHMFDINLPAYPKRQGLTFLSTSCPERHTLAWVTTQRVTSEDDLIKIWDKNIHALAINPLLAVLLQQEESKFYNEEANERILQNRLLKMEAALQQWKETFPEGVVLFGTPEDHSTFLVAPTLFGVFNEIVRLMSKPELFISRWLSILPEYQSARTGKALTDADLANKIYEINEWFSFLLMTLGTPYDARQSYTYRTVFGAIERAQHFLLSGDLRENLTNFRLALGEPSARPSAAYHSCFSTFYTLLNLLMKVDIPYQIEIDSPSMAYSPAFVQRLVHLRQLWDHPEYHYHPAFSSLQHLGTLQPPTELFEDIQAYKEKWLTLSNDERVEAHLNFLVGERTVFPLLEETLKKLPIMEAEECQNRVSMLQEEVRQMLSIESCSGCEKAHIILQNIVKELAQGATTLQKLTVSDITVAPTPLSEMRQYAEAFGNALHLLSESFQVNSSENRCGFTVLDEDRLEADEECLAHFSTLQQALKSLWGCLNQIAESSKIDIVSNSTSESSGVSGLFGGTCERLAKMVDIVASHLQTTVDCMNAPLATGEQFDDQMLEDIAALPSIVLAAQEDMRGLFQGIQCETCLKQEVRGDKLISVMNDLALALQGLYDRIYQLKAAKLIQGLKGIHQALVRIALHTVAPSTVSDTYTRLCSPTLASYYKAWVGSLELFVPSLRAALLALQRSSLNSRDMEETLKPVEESLKRVADAAEIWSNHLGVPTAFSVQTSFDVSAVSDPLLILASIVALAQEIGQYWVSLSSHISSFSERVPDLWLVAWLGKMATVHQSLAKVLTPPSGSDTWFFAEDSDFFAQNLPAALETLRADLLSPLGNKVGVIPHLQSAQAHVQRLCSTTAWREISVWTQQYHALAEAITSRNSHSNTHPAPASETPLLSARGLSWIQAYSSILSQLVEMPSGTSCFHSAAEGILLAFADLFRQALTDLLPTTLPTTLETSTTVNCGETAEQRQTLLEIWSESETKINTALRQAVIVHGDLQVLEAMIPLFQTLQKQATALVGRPFCRAYGTSSAVLNPVAAERAAEQGVWDDLWRNHATAWKERAEILQQLHLSFQEQSPCYTEILEPLTNLKAALLSFSQQLASFLNALKTTQQQTATIHSTTSAEPSAVPLEELPSNEATTNLAINEKGVVSEEGFQRLHNLTATAKEMMLSLSQGACCRDVIPFIDRLREGVQDLALALWGPPPLSGDVTPELQLLEEPKGAPPAPAEPDGFMESEEEPEEGMEINEKGIAALSVEDVPVSLSIENLITAIRETLVAVHDIVTPLHDFAVAYQPGGTYQPHVPTWLKLNLELRRLAQAFRTPFCHADAVTEQMATALQPLPSIFDRMAETLLSVCEKERERALAGQAQWLTDHATDYLSIHGVPQAEAIRTAQQRENTMRCRLHVEIRRWTNPHFTPTTGLNHTINLVPEDNLPHPFSLDS